MATKSKSEIVLGKAFGIRNIFVKDWKLAFFTDGKKRIACIPFMRNLIEYTHGEADPSFVTLTSMLHWKPDSLSLTQKALDEIYYKLFTKSADAYKNPNELVIDLIMQEAKACVTAKSGANFENKIVLAIAIRLTAERFMATKIADPAFLAGITENQTAKLLKKFQELYSSEVATIKCLNGVALMTPENIHLNAFMYEPILDMSDDRLRSLFTEASQLK
jgi:hypothetical protein